MILTALYLTSVRQLSARKTLSATNICTLLNGLLQAQGKRAANFIHHMRFHCFLPNLSRQKPGTGFVTQLVALVHYLLLLPKKYPLRPGHTSVIAHCLVRKATAELGHCQK